jgi:hypothetical protein
MVGNTLAARTAPGQDAVHYSSEGIGSAPISYQGAKTLQVRGKWCFPSYSSYFEAHHGAPILFCFGLFSFGLPRF